MFPEVCERVSLWLDATSCGSLFAKARPALTRPGRDLLSTPSKAVQALGVTRTN